MKVITDDNMHLFRPHRRAMESRLAHYIAGKLIDGYWITERRNGTGSTVRVGMSHVDGQCMAYDSHGLCMTFSDAYDAGKHYANRRMQNWTTLATR